MQKTAIRIASYSGLSLALYIKLRFNIQSFCYPQNLIILRLKYICFLLPLAYLQSLWYTDF